MRQPESPSLRLAAKVNRLPGPGSPLQSANFNIHEVIETDSKINTLHNNAEQFGA